MKKLYIVRRDFKAGGVLYTAGTLIEDPSEIKLFKIKLGERLIVEIDVEDERRLLDLKNFMEHRHGIDLVEVLKAHVSKGLKPAEPAKEKVIPTPGTPKPSAQPN